MIEKSLPEAPQAQQTDTPPSDEKHESWEADTLLRHSFAQPVRFVTYSGIKDLSKIRIKPYTLGGIDDNKNRIVLPKLDVLFAFPKEEMPTLKPHVKIRKPLQSENLEPIQNPNDRFHVADERLTQAQENKTQVEIVTRSGHVLNGRLQHFDKYVLYMQIGEKIVIVYRHGLYSFTIEEQ